MKVALCLYAVFDTHVSRWFILLAHPSTTFYLSFLVFSECRCVLTCMLWWCPSPLYHKENSRTEHLITNQHHHTHLCQQDWRKLFPLSWRSPCSSQPRAYTWHGLMKRLRSCAVSKIRTSHTKTLRQGSQVAQQTRVN